jgi:hypothetical protein
MINFNLRIPRTIRDDLLGSTFIDTEKYLQRNFFDNPDYEIWEKFSISDYRYNLKIPCDDSSIYIGIMHNARKQADKQTIDIKIEYNPAKITRIPDSLVHLMWCSSSCKIKSIDIAVDLSVHIDKITFLEGRKNINIYRGTYYIGARNSGMKIYNKAEEQNISDRDWTRIEYRIPLDMDICKEDLNLDDYIYPDVLFIDGLKENKNISGKYKCMMAGITFMPTMFQELTIQERKTLKKATESLSRVKFSDLHNDIIHCIRHIQVFYHKINQNNIDFIPDMRILHMSDEISKLFEN